LNDTGARCTCEGAPGLDVPGLREVSGRHTGVG